MKLWELHYLDAADYEIYSNQVYRCFSLNKSKNYP